MRSIVLSFAITNLISHAFRPFVFGLLLLSMPAIANAFMGGVPVPNDFPEGEEPGFSFMHALSEFGLHDMQDERWNMYGQGTYISQWKPGFPAAYTNLNGSPNSLLPKAENSFSATVTFYGGLKLWNGGEAYGAPEMISLVPFSDLKGLGGDIQNFEMQKSGGAAATWYRSRMYLRQTFNFGGISSQVDSSPLQLAGTHNSRRLVFTLGSLSVLDIFDKNTYSGDLRQQFFNMAFMANAAYDFVADSRGYSYGIAGELYFDDWVFRFGRFAPPKNPNDLQLNYSLYKYYGDQFELEHKHTLFNQPGAIRLLGYHNHEITGNFSDAIAAFQANPVKNAANCPGWNYGSENVNAPDLCWVRKPQEKFGIGINMEQRLTEHIAVFFRGMYSDGLTEVYSYTSTDRSVSLGTAFDGDIWGRNKDVIGIGYARNMLSGSHVQYLALGGVDQFIGDGAIRYEPEQVVDIYYKLNIISSAWLTADYQFIVNPG